MAGYLLTQPWNWLSEASTQTLIDLHPAYYFTKILLLNDRWAISMLMGWCSAITHIPLYRLEYGFTTLFFILLFGPVFLLSLQLKLQPKYALIVSLAVCIGFWAQIVLDMRAMSHIGILPMMLLFVLLLSTNLNQNSALLGLLFATITIVYVEIIPGILLGVILFLILNYSFQKISRSQLIRFSLFIFIATIVISPLFLHIFNFLHFQIISVMHGGHANNNWDLAYFPWLYNKPIIGFWGLSLLSGETRSLTLLLYSVLISLLFVYTFILFRKSNTDTNKAIKIVQVMSALILFEFSGLCLQGKYWAAGKALCYGYPFIMLTLSIWLSLQKNKLQVIAKYLVLSWFCIQCLLGIYRISNAAIGKDYSNYFSWGEYRLHDLNFESISKEVSKQNCRSIDVLVQNRAVAEYIEIVFGWKIPVIELNGVYFGDKIIGLQTLKTKSDCLITDKKMNNTTKAIASNRQYVLLHQ
jgi:hypothetical protein